MLSSPVINVKGVGPKTVEALSRLDIETVEGLIYHFPRSYLDRREVRPISSLKENSGQVVIKGMISAVRSFRAARGRHVTQCIVRDDTGSIKVAWFNRPYMGRTLQADSEALLSGTVSDRSGPHILNPDMEILSTGESDFLHTLGLIPLYPLTRGIGQKKMRRLIRAALEEFLAGAPENLPPRIIKNERLMSRCEALWEIHFPKDEAGPGVARERIAFEEFLALQISLQSFATAEIGSGIAHDAPPKLTGAFEKSLPFELTPAQRKAVGRIDELMRRPDSMNALLQGDVGCGKTMVALYAMLKAVENGHQAILMAPTEILVEQHAAGIRGRLRMLSGENGIDVAVLTGSRPPEEKTRALDLLASGRPALVIGTHALLQRDVEIRNAGLIVIDEQHRFGVGQRAALKEKGADADLLIMTATPIPRTLALALYGNFETVVIDEAPRGRLPVETSHVNIDGREEMGCVIEQLIGEGRQAFVVCPEVDERSERTTRPIANVARMYRKYTGRFPDFKVDVIHGKMPAEERESAVGRFHAGATQILVATTIIEVGVDAPNAAVIVIEDADRFGLAQLHQLRGRVGRSSSQSYCFLAAEPSTEAASRRIEIMTDTGDGFEISEMDLQLRGPGEFLGSAQSGVPPLRAGHLIHDRALLDRARDVAQEILGRDPALESAENKNIRTLLKTTQPGATRC